MNASGDTHTSRLPAPAGIVGVRAAILACLTLFLFRESLIEKTVGMLCSSEWSHAFAWPVLVLVYLWCRRDELKAQATEGSNFGLVVFILGAFSYFIVLSLGLFSHLFVVALLICLGGAVWYAVGWKVTRICVPLLILLFMAIPLSERSMDRFTLGIQRESLRAAALASRLIPSIELRPEGKELTYTHDGRTGMFTVAEQRFGARWLPAYATVGFFVIFCRRRTWPRNIASLALCVPAAVLCKLVHLNVWAMVSAFGGYPPVSALPRNIALICALVVMFFGAALACWLVDKVALIPEMFVVETSDEEDGEQTPA